MTNSGAMRQDYLLVNQGRFFSLARNCKLVDSGTHLSFSIPPWHRTWGYKGALRMNAALHKGRLLGGYMQQE